MKRDLGYSYNRMLFNYKNEYGEMQYFHDDMDRIWDKVRAKLKQDPEYLSKIKHKYQTNFRLHLKFFQKVSTLDLKSISDDKLLRLLKKLMLAQADSVGIAHIIEAISQKMEDELKNILVKKYGQHQANQYFIKLSVPSALSFMAQEENDLYKISKLAKSRRQMALQRHLEKYFWIQNTYRGPIRLTVEDFASRLNEVSYTKANNFLAKKNLIKELKLDSWTNKLVEIIDVSTLWQDNRKKNILKTVTYAGFLFDELSRRLKIAPFILRHFSIVDSQKISNITQIKEMEPELKERAKGTFYLWEKEKEWLIFSKEYKQLTEYLKKQENNLTHDKLMGSIANGGTAIGRAVICNNISQIYKVKKGDILVTSMTRPEYMPAIKKAAAIITDEGGITCHAAIVAREMGIPAVIGTKVATKVLRDDMMVEVRANHGLVRIL